MIEDYVPEILTRLPPRVSDVVKPWAKASPDHAALVEAAGAWTYLQLASAIAGSEAWLLESGVRPGDRVMIVGENCRAFVAVLLALAGMDAWPVVVNARLSPREIDEVRDHCGARRVIYTTNVSPHAAEHARRDGATIGNVGDLGSIAIGPLNDNVAPESLEANVTDRVASLIYTSGTTGVPKGVMLTHRNLLFVAAVSARIRALTTDDRFYGVLPMSHSVGLSVVLLGTLLSGATLYLTPHFDPIRARLAMDSERLTVMLGAPAMFGQWLQYAKLRGIESFRFPALRIIASASAPLHPALKSAVEKLFGQVLHNGYGVTECSPTISQTRIESPRADISVGPVFPGVEVKIVDSNGRAVAEGDVGELLVRGPNVMKGYYRAPEETTAAVDAEGWFNTRDLARLEGGNLFIAGRSKELIVRFGFNVYPAEIEAVLNAHPAVARSAVIGRSVIENEEVVAFVQPMPGAQLTHLELAEYAARNLTPYKRPSQILLVTTMPLTPTGKVMKEELARLAASPVPAGS
jgi:long-chain acyl-CoA synthetase